MIPPVFTIYCRELPQREAVARAHFAAAGIPATWWAAPHGTTWGLSVTNPFDPDKFISPGHVSLLIAHWTLWGHLSHVLSADDSVAMVCEDDCVFPDDFAARYAEAIVELDANFPDWQFVFLGQAEKNDPGLWGKVSARIGPPDSKLCKISWVWGTHCYLVRKSALETLQRRFPPASRNMDQQLYQRVLEPGHVRWGCYVPGFVRQRTYDYSGSGSPEWAPSTITAHDVVAVAEPEVVDAPTAAYRKKVADFAAVMPKPTEQSPEVIAASLKLTEPFPCIYRGEPAEPVMAFGRVVPTWECALLNRPCHQKPNRHVADATACEACPHRLEMGATGEARSKLPLPDGHFNPSMIEWDGRIILATRDSWGHSRVGLWELTNPEADWSGAWAVTPISSVASGHPDAPRLEDPRLFIAPNPDTGKDALHASFSMPDGYPPKLVRVGYVRFAPDLKSVEHCEVFPSPNGSAYEKNWVPGKYDSRHTFWVYNSKPHHVVYVMNAAGRPRNGFRTRNDFAWTGGVIRGGCPPVLHDGVYYHFYHGCLKRPHGNVYTVGCLTFESTPPFRVLRQTPTPIVWPDLPGPGESVVKRYVVFPGGAIPHAGAWHIACGIDDTACRIFKLTFEEVEAALDATASDMDSVTSIRDTRIATGVPDAERPR